MRVEIKGRDGVWIEVNTVQGYYGYGEGRSGERSGGIDHVRYIYDRNKEYAEALAAMLGVKARSL